MVRAEVVVRHKPRPADKTRVLIARRIHSHSVGGGRAEWCVRDEQETERAVVARMRARLELRTGRSDTRHAWTASFNRLARHHCA